MAKFTLCPLCAGRFKNDNASPIIAESPSQESCHICGGLLAKAGAMVVSAIAESQGFEWGTFSVSSSFPRKVMVRESEVADWFSPGSFTSLKNSANAFAAEGISRATGRKNSQRSPDMVFEFDYGSGACRAKPAPLFVHGHYLKLSRSFCQSRWHCSDCKGAGCSSCGGSGHNYPSVEEELSNAIAPAFSASGGILHASGREDVDVRCLGAGRPFVLELQGPQKRTADLAKLEQALAANKNVQAVRLRIVDKAFSEAMCTSHFDKKYIATISADRPLGAKDAKKAETLSGKLIQQQTPQRVLSRRADLVRPRTVESISAKALPGGRLSLEILAEAGTYIKELISSDGGRTKPSISKLLGCKAVCVELDVVEIRDYFLQSIGDALPD